MLMKTSMQFPFLCFFFFFPTGNISLMYFSSSKVVYFSLMKYMVTPLTIAAWKFLFRNILDTISESPRAADCGTNWV